MAVRVAGCESSVAESLDMGRWEVGGIAACWDVAYCVLTAARDFAHVGFAVADDS